MSKLRNVYQNYTIKKKFKQFKKDVQLNPRKGNALIISTGTSYSKFGLNEIKYEIAKNNITTVIGVNNLMLYDPEVEVILTDYIISYSGYFEKELTEELISFYSTDGDFGDFGAAESLKACKKMLDILLEKSDLTLWVPINNFSDFNYFPHVKPFSNLSNMLVKNQNDITKVIYGNGMVAIFAAALARNYGAEKIFSIGLDNDAFRSLEWDAVLRKFTYNYGHFYDENRQSVERYFSGGLSEYFENISKIHRLFEDYKIINLDETSISGFKQ